MKRIYSYIAFAILAVLGASCSKNSITGDGNGPDKKESKIGFGTVSTRGVDDLVADETKPLQIKVYDYYTKAGASEIEYIDETIQEAEGSTAENNAWAFVQEGKKNSYSWKNGTHKFFGWVSLDENKTTVPGLTYSDKVLTVAANTELPGTANTDYRYSDLVTVEWTKALEDTPVELTMKHLSAALTYKVTAFASDASSYSVTGVTIGNVVKSGSASVDYTGDAEDVTYTLANTKGDISLLAPDGDNAVYTCVWPQTIEDAKATVSYTIDGVATTATVDIPDTEWKAGNYYSYDIQIVEKGIELTFTVAPWEGEEKNIDTSNGSINMSNVTWMNTKVKLTENGDEVNTVNISGYRVNMYKNPYVNKNGTWTKYVDNNGYFPAQGYFTVNYPKQGLYKIEMIQASYWNNPVPEGIYEIWIYDDSQNPAAFRKINPDGEPITNDTVYFQIRATKNVPAEHEEYRGQINILFKAADSEGSTENSEWISGFSEIRANYAMVIDAETN